MGWIEWCSFFLGGLVFWLLGWLLSWLFRGNTLRMQNQLSEAQAELGRLQADLTGYKAVQSKLTLAEQELAGLRVRVQDFDSLKVNFGAVSKQLDAATLKIQGLEGQLKDFEALKTQLANLQTRLGSLQIERDKLKADYDGLLARFENLEGERNRLSTQILNYQGEMAVLSRQVEALRQDRDQQKSESGKLASMGGLMAVFEGLRQRFGGKQPEELEAHFATLQGEAERTKSELDKVRGDYENALALRKQLEGELQGLQGRIGSLEADQGKVGALEAEIERYKNEFSGLQARYATLEADHQKLREAYENRIGSLEDEKSQLSSELQTLQTRLVALEQERDSHQQESSSLASKLAGLGGSVAALEAIRTRLGNLQPADLETRIVAIQNERNQYASELDVLRKRVEAVAGERDHLRAEVEGLQKRLDDLSTTSNNVTAERSKLQAEVQKLRADLNQSQGAYQDLETVRRELSDLRTRLAKTEEERNWFSGEVQGLRKELETIGGSNTEVEQFKANYLALQARIPDYEAQLKKAHEDQAQMQANYSALQARISDYEVQLTRAQERTAEYNTLAADFAAMQARVSEAETNQIAAAPTLTRPAKPRKSKPRPPKEVIGYRVTQSRTFRAEVVPEGHDPLGVIEGVGAAYQQRLWDAGIKTFEDLAGTPEARLREVIGKDLEFDEWIVEARRFVRGVYKLSRATAGGTRRKADDLTRIEGIGPKMRDALLAAGITTFEELEAATEGQLHAAIEAAGMSFAPSIPTWSRQAAYLVWGDEAGFQEYIARLTAGREE